MKILIAGDTHCSRHQFTYLFRMAKENKCKLIIVVGDYGYWPRDKYGVAFLEHCQGLARKEGIDVWWLDGNHEDHDYLDAWVNGNTTEPLVTRGHGDEKYPNVKYLPRGCKFELDGVTFMSYGGAFSVDRRSRVKYVDWFPQEVVELDAADRIEDGHVDILLSHEVPTGYNFPYDDTTPTGILSKESRDALYKIVQKVTPFFCFGGHHHLRRTYGVMTSEGWAECHILNCDMSFKESWHVLDLQEVKEKIGK